MQMNYQQAFCGENFCKTVSKPSIRFSSYLRIFFKRPYNLQARNQFSLKLVFSLNIH